MDKTVLDTVLINVSRWNDILMIKIYFKSFNLSQKLKLVTCTCHQCVNDSAQITLYSRVG